MQQLRPYQVDVVNRVHQAWAEGARAPCVVLPCGAGKSCIVADMARRTTWKGNRVLFLVHRKELVDQIVRTFIGWGVDMEYCTVGMVQTITRRLHKMQPPSLIITDENHHSLAASYRRIYEAFPKAYRVGVTATPVRLNGDGLGDVNDRLVIGVSAKWLIENHFLAPYDYFAPSVADLTGLHVKHGEYIASEIESRLMSPAIYGDVIANYKSLGKGEKAICYCASIKHSKAVAEAFSKAGIPAVHLDGETPKPERNRIITDFRAGKIRVLCNVDLISEGFDVPDCGCAILLRPTKSLTLYIQQSMRCMRYLPDKRAVIIDHVGNYARFGMPDDDREWSLEKKDRTKKAPREQNEVKIVTCPECFRVFEPNDLHRCPWCGAPLPKKVREIQEKAAELVRIEGFTLRYTQPSDCKTYAELQAYGKQHGYKPGWSYIMARKLGIPLGGTA